MGRGIQCCKNCEQRHSRCHATCSQYIAERNALDEDNEKLRQDKLKHTYPTLNCDGLVYSVYSKRAKRKFKY